MPIELLNVAAHPPVSPADCALVVAIPLTKAEFLADPAAGRQSNFAHVYTTNFGGDREAAWQAYERYAALAAHVMEDVERMKVTVRQAASLDDFHRAVATFKVVILVAQWRDARFMAEDIVDAPAVWRLTQTSVASDGAALAAGLNSLMGAGDAPAGTRRSLTPSERTSQQYDWLRKRHDFEVRYPGITRGGAGVEFKAQFHTIEEILGGISSAYEELLDLTVCQSVLLGEELRRRCPKCAVLVNSNLTSFDLRFAFIHGIVDLIHREPMAWEDASFTIRKAILKYGQRHTR